MMKSIFPITCLLVFTALVVHGQDEPRGQSSKAPFYTFADSLEEQCYSGSVLVEQDRVIAMYHGRNLGNMVAVSRDPLLLNWEKVTGGTVIPLEKDGVKHHFLSPEPLPYRIYDPCIWKKNGLYYSLSGSVEYSGPAGKPVPAEFLFRNPNSRRDPAHADEVACRRNRGTSSQQPAVVNAPTPSRACQATSKGAHSGAERCPLWCRRIRAEKVSNRHSLQRITSLCTKNGRTR